MTVENRGVSTSASSWLDRALWIVGALLLIAVVGFGVFYYRDRYVHANESLMERQVRHLKEMVRQNPTDPDLRVVLAEWHLENGMQNQAILQGLEALELNADHMEALILLGRAYAAKGDDEQALDYFAVVVELNKDNEMAVIDQRMNLVYYELGELYRQRGDYALAVEALTEALRVNWSDADARYALAMTYHAQGEHEAAVEQFNEAVRYVPVFAEAYEGMQASYEAMGKTTEAAYAEGMAAFSRAEYYQAVSLLEMVTQDNPEFYPAYLGLGLVYEQLAQEQQAIAALQRYLEADPESIAARQALGRLGAWTVEP